MVARTAIVIYDSYNNVLIVQRGKTKEWSLVEKDIKGKETGEKSINKAVDNDLNCTIFDLSTLGEYVINEEKEESLLVYTGMIRQHVVCHKTIKEVRWINKNEIDNYKFSGIERDILIDFYKKIQE